MAKLDCEKAVSAFMKLREARAALKKKFEEADADLKEKQTVIEVALLKELQSSKTDSMSTKHGTFFKVEDVIPNAADWEAFYGWVKENDAFEALEKRIKKTFITEYMEANEGKLPPGVNAYREYKVRVRRKA